MLTHLHHSSQLAEKRLHDRLRSPLLDTLLSFGSTCTLYLIMYINPQLSTSPYPSGDYRGASFTGISAWTQITIIIIIPNGARYVGVTAQRIVYQPNGARYVGVTAQRIVYQPNGARYVGVTAQHIVYQPNGARYVGVTAQRIVYQIEHVMLVLQRSILSTK